MIALFSRIPRPVALWLAGMSLGCFAVFLLVHTLITRAFPVFAYQQPLSFSDLFSSVVLCAIAFTLFNLGFRLLMVGYHSIKP
ncbi:hypothetical protein Q9323_25340 (plasmid) [Pseudomonas fulva]|uniref:hypothetical protein n=1 Tax=Pseudomonas fulva TaxID=47880 RepID=UPI0031F69A4C